MQEDANAQNAGETWRLSDLEVADESIAVEFESQVQRDDGSTVVVSGMGSFFRRGRLIGGVLVVGVALEDTEKQRLQGKVKSLAETMNERMRPVLAASIGPSPETAAPQ